MNLLSHKNFAKKDIPKYNYIALLGYARKEKSIVIFAFDLQRRIDIYNYTWKSRTH